MTFDECIEEMAGRPLPDQAAIAEEFMQFNEGVVTIEQFITIYEALSFADQGKEVNALHVDELLNYFFETSIDQVNLENFPIFLRGLDREDLEVNEVDSFQLSASRYYIQNKEDGLDIKGVAEIVTMLIKEIGMRSQQDEAEEQDEALKKQKELQEQRLLKKIVHECLRVYFTSHIVDPEEIGILLRGYAEDINRIIAQEILKALPIVHEEAFRAVSSSYSLGPTFLTCYALSNVDTINFDKDFYIDLWKNMKSRNSNLMRSGLDDHYQVDESGSLSNQNFVESLQYFCGKRNIPLEGIIEVQWFLERIIPCLSPANFGIHAAKYKAEVIKAFLASSSVGIAEYEEFRELLRHCAVPNLEADMAVSLYSGVTSKDLTAKDAGKILHDLYPDWDDRKKVIRLVMEEVLQDEAHSDLSRKDMATAIMSLSIEPDNLEDFFATFNKANKGVTKDIKDHFYKCYYPHAEEERPRDQALGPEASALVVNKDLGKGAKTTN